MKPRRPASVRSRPSTILWAFRESGYWSNLTADLREMAEKDPASWLRGHPYLFSWYPAFFRDITGTVKSDKKTRQAARRQRVKRGGPYA